MPGTVRSSTETAEAPAVDGWRVRTTRGRLPDVLLAAPTVIAAVLTVRSADSVRHGASCTMPGGPVDGDGVAPWVRMPGESGAGRCTS